MVLLHALLGKLIKLTLMHADYMDADFCEAEFLKKLKKQSAFLNVMHKDSTHQVAVF